MSPKLSPRIAQLAITSHTLAGAFDHVLVIGFLDTAVHQSLREGLLVVGSNGFIDVPLRSIRRIPSFRNRNLFGGIAACSASICQFAFCLRPILRRRLAFEPAIDQRNLSRAR